MFAILNFALIFFQIIQEQQYTNLSDVPMIEQRLYGGHLQLAHCMLPTLADALSDDSHLIRIGPHV